MDQLNMSNKSLIEDQMRHIYEKADLEGVANVDTIKQEIEQEKLSGGNIDDEVNPYYETITNKVEKENVSTSHMEHWSILSNVVNYVQYDRNSKKFHELVVKALDQENHREMYEKLQDYVRQTLT